MSAQNLYFCRDNLDEKEQSLNPKAHKLDEK